MNYTLKGSGFRKLTNGDGEIEMKPNQGEAELELHSNLTVLGQLSY